MKKRTPLEIEALGLAFQWKELKGADGKGLFTWEEVAEKMRPSGLRHTASTLRSAYSRSRDEIIRAAEELNLARHSESLNQDESPEPDPPVADERCEHAEGSEHAEPCEPDSPVAEVQNERSHRCAPDGPVAEAGRDEHEERCEQTDPTELEDRMRSIAREVFNEMITTMQTVPTTPVIDEDLPPEPTRTGKAENRRYERVTLTIDKNLWKRVLRESKRLRVSHGRAVDVLLWRALGKPRLSYQTDEPDE